MKGLPLTSGGVKWRLHCAVKPCCNARFPWTWLRFEVRILRLCRRIPILQSEGGRHVRLGLVVKNVGRALKGVYVIRLSHQDVGARDGEQERQKCPRLAPRGRARILRDISGSYPCPQSRGTGDATVAAINTTTTKVVLLGSLGQPRLGPLVRQGPHPQPVDQRRGQEVRHTGAHHLQAAQQEGRQTADEQGPCLG